MLYCLLYLVFRNEHIFHGMKLSAGMILLGIATHAQEFIHVTTLKDPLIGRITYGSYVDFVSSQTIYFS